MAAAKRFGEKLPSSPEPNGSAGCVSITDSDNLAKCREHYLDTRHSRLSRTTEVVTTLYHLPNRHHLDCLNSLLATVKRDQGLSTSDHQTSSLLKDYWSLDPRVRTLGYWASVVRIDRLAEGTLPPNSFANLLVYFLQ